MKSKIEGRPSFAYVKITIDPRETIIAESDAMANMDPRLTHQARMNGGFFGGLLRKFFGKESFFVNHYENHTTEPLTITLTQPKPGDIQMMKVEGEGVFLQPGAFICRTPGVKVTPVWAGIRSFFAREGLFRLRIHGSGYLWYGGYGNIYEKELDGEYIVDSSHIIGYSPSVVMRIQMAGGLISSFTSGEGFVTRMVGKGKIYMQSRSLSGLASWLNPRI